MHTYISTMIFGNIQVKRKTGKEKQKNMKKVKVTASELKGNCQF